MTAEVVSLDAEIRKRVLRELEIARQKFGDRFDLQCMEGRLDEVHEDRRVLRLLKVFNRNASTFTGVVGRVE